jgi:PII-like signaling protein
MNLNEVVVVRVYCSEAGHQHQKVLDLLHRDHRIAGVTAFRGIAGFGSSGQVHEAGLLYRSLDLPVIVEFFDRPEKVAEVLPLLHQMVAPGHILSWPAQANLD